MQEYLRECLLTTGNHMANTKYCCLYILKTHKKYFDQFKLLQPARTYQDFCKVIFGEGSEEVLKEISLKKEAFEQMYNGNIYKKMLKDKLLPLSSERQQFLDQIKNERQQQNQVVGQKRKKQPEMNAEENSKKQKAE